MLVPRCARAQQGASDLAKATQNPVGDLTTIPLQFNFTSGGELEDRTLFNLNLQPVIPIRAGAWNIVARTIVPYIDAPAPNDTRQKGLGDIQQQVFFTPARPGSLIWGVGPTFSFPTATNDAVRSGDWAAGPALVLVKMTGHWVIGGLVSQIWTFAGDDFGPDVDLLTIQPAINFNFGAGWALAFSPIITANWSAPDGEEWTVPLGLGISKVTAIGQRPVSLGIQYYDNVERPTGTGRSLLRFAVSFLFPVQRAGRR